MIESCGIFEQHLVRNAAMRRTCEGTNAPVHVCRFDDRIEIISPGGPYGAANVESFRTPGAVNYRNPILAEAMRVTGLAQGYGSGIPAAQRELTDSGPDEPEFRVDSSSVRCTVRVGECA